MSNFIINAVTGTVAAGTATAGLVVTGISAEGARTEEARTRIAEEVIANTTRAVLAPPAWIVREQTTAAANTCIKLMRTFISAIQHADHGKNAVIILTVLAAKLAAAEIKNILVEEAGMGVWGAALGTVTAAILSEMGPATTNGSDITLVYLSAIVITRLLSQKMDRIAPMIGGNIMARGLATKAAEVMGGPIAAEAWGGLTFAAAGGTATAAIIAKVSKEAVRKGADERVATWASIAALILWAFVQGPRALESHDTSATDLISTWVAISALSGLMAAVIAAALPQRPADQN